MKSIKQKSIAQIVSMPRVYGKRKPNGRVNGHDRNSRAFETRFIPRYKKMPVIPKDLPTPSFSESSNKILQERYLLKGGNLEIVESVAERFWHIAFDIASGDFDFRASSLQVMELARDFYSMMVSQQFLPNSPTIMNAGKQNGLQYSACFVLPVGDSLPEIFDSVKYAALIHQTGGGTGFAFSRLRPAGSIVNTTGGVASGPVSFLRVFNAATESIKQGGTRRGANMGILRVDHPDILEFIRSKAELDDLNKPVYEGVAPMLPDDSAREYFKTLLLDKQIANFNISVAVTNKFIEALQKGEDFELIAPHSGEVAGKLNAKEVFDEIIERAWRTGDPGLIFIDRINNSPANPVPKLETIESTNPCVTGDTWIHTSAGPKQVYELVGKPFKARVNGNEFPSTEKGFFETGEKQVYSLQTKEGYHLRLTSDHKVKRVTKLSRYLIDSEWIEAATLTRGDKIILNNNRIQSQWQGNYTFTDGDFLGLLIGDGTLKTDKAVLSVWNPEDTGSSAVMLAFSSLLKVTLNARLTTWMYIGQRSEHRLSDAYIQHLG
jgi:ribonucleoside-diphosphate reductase alpha chain